MAVKIIKLMTVLCPLCICFFKLNFLTKIFNFYFQTQWTTFGGKCGLCGDDYGTPTPRPNELGGQYGEGTIVKTYTNEHLAEVIVDVTANHEGYFYFNVCNMDKQDIETEECYLANRLQLADGSDKLFIGTTTGKITANVVFPEDLSCQHCVLRWTYNAGMFGNQI